METLDSVLEHYGIKGMKWGVRRTQEQIARAKGKRIAKKAAPPKAQSEDAAKASSAKQKAKKEGVSALSNSELKALNERMELETKYNKLNPKEVSKGKAFVDDLMKEYGKEAQKMATQYATTQIADMLLKQK